MNVTVTGATGFIGRRLTQRLLADGHAVHALSRRANVDLGPGVWLNVWDPAAGEPPPESIKSADAIVHLAGEPVAQRWSDAAKSKIRASRVHGTRHLVQALSTQSHRPKVLVCSSAIGIYGNRVDETLTESSRPGEGFLPDVCIEWEKQAELAESLGIRVVRLRTGIVLGTSGGALAKMLTPFRMGVGGRLGSGRQWMSWIHLDDLVGLIRHAIDNPLSGPVNGTAPNPVTNSEFTKTLGSVLGRPTVFPVPGFALKILMGEMSEILLDSQKVQPEAARRAGYPFRFERLDPALREILTPATSARTAH